MNWRLSKLDNISLISNSDSHSLPRIGREANIFDTELSYEGVISAIKSGIPNITTSDVQNIAQSSGHPMSKTLEVSYRLTAPRFDWKGWSNYADSKWEGLNLDKLLQ